MFPDVLRLLACAAQAANRLWLIGLLLAASHRPTSASASLPARLFPYNAVMPFYDRAIRSARGCRTLPPPPRGHNASLFPQGLNQRCFSRRLAAPCCPLGDGVFWTSQQDPDSLSKSSTRRVYSLHVNQAVPAPRSCVRARTVSCCKHLPPSSHLAPTMHQVYVFYQLHVREPCACRHGCQHCRFHNFPLFDSSSSPCSPNHGSHTTSSAPRHPERSRSLPRIQRSCVRPRPSLTYLHLTPRLAVFTGVLSELLAKALPKAES